MTDPQPDADELADRADELKTEVAALRLEVKQLGRRTNRAERASLRAGLAVTVLLLVVAVLGWVAYQGQQTSARLGSVVQDSLCPTFGLVLGGYDPTTREPGEARDRYEDTFRQMRAAYDALACQAEFVPPRKGS